MSLTSILKYNKETGDKFRKITEILEININDIIKDTIYSKIEVPYRLDNYEQASQVGTAFDYLARFITKHYQYKLKGTSHEETYVAQHGLNILLKKTDNENNKYQDIYNEALQIIDSYIKSEENDDKLFRKIINISVYFTKLEVFYRSGYTKEKEEDLKDKAEFKVQRELFYLSYIYKLGFEKRFNIMSKKCEVRYNPNMPKCALAVGGADADIIIENTLIDFKTSKYLTSIKEDFVQLICYYLFLRIDYPEIEVESICLYYARYNKFIEYQFKKEDREKIERATEEMTELIYTLRAKWDIFM